MSVMSADARLKWTCLIQVGDGTRHVYLLVLQIVRRLSILVVPVNKGTLSGLRRDQGLDRLARKHCLFSGKAVEALISWKGSANICKNVFAAASVASPGVQHGCASPSVTLSTVVLVGSGDCEIHLHLTWPCRLFT